MPNHDTFSIKPIAEFIARYNHGVSIDPFARNSTLATYRNDLNPDTCAQYHVDAEDFMKAFAPSSADIILFDPPYSPRQIAECYQHIGRKVTGKDTQNAALYKRVRDACDPVLKTNGVIISFGWNSNGMGIGRNYHLEELLLVAHGGGHNDTICLAERKL